MFYEIVELEPYSGNEAKIYSIISEGEDYSLFEQFVEEYQTVFKNEIKDILKRLMQIGNVTGARESFFKHHEGKHGDLVCALYDMPGKNLRLYCIRFGKVAVILGGGGMKSKGIRAWQEDDKLSNAASLIIKYAQDIFKRMEEGEIYWSEDKSELLGNLNNINDE